MRTVFGLFIVCLALGLHPLPACANIAIAEDRASGVVLAYLRIGEDSWHESSLPAEQFRAHAEELASGEYHVMRLPDMLAALRNNETLPPDSIAITFEGAYASAYESGMKLLLEKRIPFTVFVASDNADKSTGEYLGWQDLRALAESGLVDFGILPASQARLSQWPREKILAEIHRAKVRFRQEMDAEPRLFSYPFGEYSLSYRDIVAEQGFDGAFGLHSGTLAPFSDFLALPRFTMTGPYGGLERFRMVSRALPLPATEVEPQDPLLTDPAPAIGFTLPESLAVKEKSLSCHISGQPAPKIEFLGARRVELRLAQPLEDERIRVNCTMPVPQGGSRPPRWRWLGMLLVLKNAGAPSLQPVPPP